MSNSETSEYIMGQVRSMNMQVIHMKRLLRGGDKVMLSAHLEQLDQEFTFLLSMLEKHPPYTPSEM